MSITPVRLIVLIAVTIVITTTVVVAVVHRDDAARQAADKRLTEFHPVDETPNPNDNLLQYMDLAKPDRNPPERK